MADGESEGSTVQTAIHLVRAVAWPSVIFFLVLSFWTPLQRIANRVSPLVERIESVSVGGVKFNVSKEFIDKRASDAVRKAVNSLKPETLKYILEHERAIHRTTRTTFDPEELDLIATGLCTELNWKALDELQREDSKREHKYMAGMDCGSKYEDVRVFLLELVPELIERSR
ncbi:hypothetical protein MW290_28160 [Aquincola tertiaricarbonis]|uniref:Uncharacterized protein n=1 Tax=Aquincola tertiaricarbonis TaxID=391953 RepID=A0ABY4SEK2_AQUTE|nr:hypothetical protein [Aquincola tertiaricarbonis]URI09441.1 hypothetical protein MW290_28160 [Aquincola tertiaricarbonis]